MASSPCLFCKHSNLVGAKFCNDCGSPLRLKACSQCEAVNDRAAKKCYRCGVELPVQLTTIEPAPVSSGAEAAAAAAPSSDVGFEPARTPLPESAAETLNVLRRPSGDETAGAGEHPVEALAREPRFLGEHLTPPPAPQGATQVVCPPELAPATAQYRRSRAALSTVLLVAVAMSAYYVYRHPAQLKHWLGEGQPDPGVPVAADPGHAPSPSTPAKIGVAPSSSPTLGVGTASVATVGSTGTTAGAESATKVTAAPGTRADIRPSRPDGVSGDAPAPPLATRTDPAERAPIRAGAIAAQPAHEPMRSAAPRVDAAQAPSTRLPRSYPAAATATPVRPRATDIRVDVSPDAPRVSVCTEAVAALGFCNPSRQGKSK